MIKIIKEAQVRSEEDNCRDVGEFVSEPQLIDDRG